MLNFLEKSRGRLVRLLFPSVERFYPFLSLVLILAAWSVPAAYWPVRVVLFWLWFVNIEINQAGTMERDHLPVQPGSGPFYHIYRFIDRFFYLFLLIWLAVMLVPGPRWVRNVFLGVFVTTVILRAIGDRKYRPEKPEE